jgi:hypothetical protein
MSAMSETSKPVSPPMPGPPSSSAGAVPGPGPGPGPARVAPPAPAETGHPAVDAALARLDDLAEVPSEAHAELFEGVHEQLRQTLAALDQPRP